MSALAASTYRLTPTEEILYAAICNAEGRVVSYAALAIAMGREYPCPSSDSDLMRAHISNLRSKLPPWEADLIRTRRGVGYYNAGGLYSHYLEAASCVVPAESAAPAWAWIESQRRAR